MAFLKNGPKKAKIFPVKIFQKILIKNVKKLLTLRDKECNAENTEVMRIDGKIKSHDEKVISLLKPSQRKGFERQKKSREAYPALIAF